MFLTVLDSSLILTRHLSSERNFGEFLVVETVRYDQVLKLDLPTHCKCGEQEDQQDHRCQDVSHRKSLTGNVGIEESGVEVYSDYLRCNKS